MIAFDPVGQMQRSAKTAGGFGLCTILLFLGGCEQTNEKNKLSDAIFPDSINLPVFDGTRKTNECQIASLYADQDVNIECIMFPINKLEKDGNNYPWHPTVGKKYGEIIKNSGYLLLEKKGASIVYEKPLENSCKARLGVIFWLNAEPEQAKTALEESDYSEIEESSIIFIEDKEPLCSETVED